MSEIYYCKKCHDKKRVMSYDKAKEIIEKVKPGSEVKDMCISVCGLGKNKFFVYTEDELVVGETLEDVINQLGEI